MASKKSNETFRREMMQAFWDLRGFGGVIPPEISTNDSSRIEQASPAPRPPPLIRRTLVTEHGLVKLFHDDEPGDEPRDKGPIGFCSREFINRRIRDYREIP